MLCLHIPDNFAKKQFKLYLEALCYLQSLGKKTQFVLISLAESGKQVFCSTIQYHLESI